LESVYFSKAWALPMPNPDDPGRDEAHDLKTFGQQILTVRDKAERKAK
jgi:hypothetical protein